MKKKIITISREYGSGGRLIGKKLAADMGIPYYDNKELIERISDEQGLSKELMEQAEMKAKNSFFYSLSSAFAAGGSGPESLPLNERFFLAQFDVIKEVAEEGPCVIVGRCADYILRDIPGITNVFIYAELDDRIRRAVDEYGIEEGDVKKTIEGIDKARANYYNYHTGRKWGDSINYNLCIDSGYISIENLVKLIENYIELKKDK